MTTYTTDKAFGGFQRRIEDMIQYGSDRDLVSELESDPKLATLEAARAAFATGDDLDDYVDHIVEPYSEAAKS